jgi:CRISPR-associated protein Cmr6
MPLIAPLPAAVRALLAQNTHPGLMLDKYVESWDPDAPPGKLSERVQKPAVQRVVDLSRQAPPGFDLAALLARRQQVHASLKARILRGVTAGPLTLHLARASALENAGICLHPLYGFTYLPGSGLKGLAHAYACEVWLAGQPEREKAWNTICDVFGWAPSPWLGSLAQRLGQKAPEESQAGAVVFHDGWPETWPSLLVDILNSHHPSYYQHADRGEAPGDWDNPVPVYFLAVPAGQAFTFAVSKRRDDEPASGGRQPPVAEEKQGADAPRSPVIGTHSQELINLACEWLAGGLEHLGAGAKTATGYGSFRVEMEASGGRQPPVGVQKQGADAPRSPAFVREEFSCNLELVTPAFLAGASQQREDCDLRPATLRGLLRWWWRTLHAGFVDVPTLARLEAAVWGDTECGGAVRLTVEPADAVVPRQYDKDAIRQRNGLPAPPNSKTTQGLWYHSFGMDDRRTIDGKTQRFQRWLVLPGARWTVRLTARPAVGDVLGQARAALWLLCYFGGAGSKARKGFGSFADPADLQSLNFDACRALAADFRKAHAVGRPNFDANLAGSPSVEQLLPFADLPLGWTNHWFALDQVGDAAQRFAQRYKHCLEKKGLGLPRKIGHPATGTFRQSGPVKDRHASPAWYHLARTADGELVLRVAAFPAKYLPNLRDSQVLLGQLLDHLRQEMGQRLQQYRQEGRRPPVDPSPPPAPPGAGTAPVAPRPAEPRAGDRVQAELLAEKTAKGGWRARHVDSGRAGPVVNSADVPADKKAGDRLELIVVSINPREISFRYPTAADAAPKKPAGKGKPPGRGPGGWRNPGTRR